MLAQQIVLEKLQSSPNSETFQTDDTRNTNTIRRITSGSYTMRTMSGSRQESEKLPDLQQWQITVLIINLNHMLAYSGQHGPENKGEIKREAWPSFLRSLKSNKRYQTNKSKHTTLLEA